VKSECQDKLMLVTEVETVSLTLIKTGHLSEILFFVLEGKLEHANGRI
jgi:hypothetical protein